jgi:hypothetical protein
MADTLVVTWQSADGSRINLTEAQEGALRRVRRWPKSDRGQELCQVHAGRHMGQPISWSELADLVNVELSALQGEVAQ